MSRYIDWETMIPRSTINIYPTMIPIEELPKPRKGNTHTRIGPPLLLTTPERRSEEKWGSGIAG
jgi:hypothetical protein